MAANPSILIKVAANVEQLKKDLLAGQSAVNVTTAGMQKMVSSFSGERLVQQARNVTAAIHQVGVSSLSAGEASRGLVTLERAMEKLQLTGQQIPVGMQSTANQLRAVAEASQRAIPAGTQLTAVYRQFDGVLQAMGINIGPQVKLLEDVANAARGAQAASGAASGGLSGLTGALRLLGPAAAVVATAVGAWKFGTHIGEVSGLTDAIAKGTAALKGYGDVQQEEMLARMQSIELLGKAEANWKRQAESVAAAKKATEEHSEELRRNWFASANNADQLKQLEKQLETVKTKRLEDTRATYAASQAQSIFGKETETATESVKRQATALAEREESMDKIAAAEVKRRTAVDDFMRGVVGRNQNGDELFRTLGGQLETAEEAERRRTAGGTFELKSLTQRELADVNMLYDPFQKGGNFGLLERLKDLASRTHDPDNNREFFSMQRDQAELARLRITAESLGLPRFAGGVTNFSGGPAIVGERGPELLNLPRGSDVIPNHKLGGTTVVNNFTFNMGGIVGDRDQVARAVTDTIMRQLRSQGFRAPTGA